MEGGSAWGEGVWAPPDWRPSGVGGCQWNEGDLWRKSDVRNACEAALVREGVRRGLFVDSSARERKIKGVMKHMRHLVIDPIPQARIAALKLFKSIGPRARIPAWPASGRATASGSFTRMANELMMSVFDVLTLHCSWQLAKTCKRLWCLRCEAAVAERAPLIHDVAKMLEDGPPRLHSKVRAHPGAEWGDGLNIEVRPAMLPPRTKVRPTLVSAGVLDFILQTKVQQPDTHLRPWRKVVKKILQRYCEKAVVDSRSIQFEVEGRRIDVGDTHNDIRLRCDDSIGVGLVEEHRRQALLVLLCHCSPAERDPHEHLLPKLGGLWVPDGVCPDYNFQCWPAD